MFLNSDIKLAKDVGRAGVSTDVEYEKSSSRGEGWYAFTRRLMRVNGGRQRKQVYRMVCITCLVAGATTGAQIGRFGVWGALWCAAGVKVGILVAIAFWKADDGSKREGENVD